MRVWLLLYCNHAESGWYREEIPFALRMFAGVKGFFDIRKKQFRNWN